MLETAITTLLWFDAAFVGILVLAFMVGVVQAIARRRHPEPDTTLVVAEDVDEHHEAEALAIGRYILSHGLDKGEVWVRVRRCAKHGGQHLDIGLLPSLEDLS